MILTNRLKNVKKSLRVKTVNPLPFDARLVYRIAEKDTGNGLVFLQYFDFHGTETPEIFGAKRNLNVKIRLGKSFLYLLTRTLSR